MQHEISFLVDLNGEHRIFLCFEQINSLVAVKVFTYNFR